MKKSTLRPLLFLLAIIAIIIACSYGIYRENTLKPNTVIEPELKPQAQELFHNQELPEVITKNLSPVEIQEVEALINLFVQSDSAESASLLIQNPVNDQELFKKHYTPFPSFVGIDQVSTLEYTNGSRSALYFLRYNGVGREIQAYAKPGEDFKIDWRSTYLCGSIPFVKYIDTLPKVAEDVMCYILVDVYYTKDFPEKEYQSLVLTNYSLDKKVFAYVKRDSHMDEKIANAMLETTLKLHGKNTVRAALSIKLKNESPSPTAEIIDVLSTNWIQHLQF